MSLVRLGVDFEAIRKIDSTFENSLSAKERETLSQYSSQAQALLKYLPD
jgi:hypothetical protein